jgi:hypothetical protein
MPLAFQEEEAVMRMRSLYWNLLVWNPSAGPADPYGAPRFTHIAWAVRTRWRPIFLITGALLMVTSLMLLHSTAAFIAGLLLVAASAPAAGPQSPDTAMVRTWEWLHKAKPINGSTGGHSGRE